jgi:hypothetical protein
VNSASRRAPVRGGPPGSTWARATTAAPRNANTERGRELRRLLHGRAVAYGLVLGSAAALVAGASLHSLGLALAGPLAACLVVAALAFAAADRRSERDFFRGYAAARGLAYVGRTRLEPLTPLLGAGDEERCEHWMQGRLADGCDGGLGRYVYEVHGRDSQGHAKRRETRRFTIGVVEIAAGTRPFPAIFLCARRGIFGGLDGRDWLSHVNRHEVELESAKLCERYELWIDDAQDELLLRELFTPSFEVLLAEHPLAPCFEYRAGTLVVYVERRLDDEGSLDTLRHVTAQIADRFSTEAAEEPAG